MKALTPWAWGVLCLTSPSTLHRHHANPSINTVLPPPPPPPFHPSRRRRQCQHRHQP